MRLQRTQQWFHLSLTAGLLLAASGCLLKVERSDTPPPKATASAPTSPTQPSSADTPSSANSTAEPAAPSPQVPPADTTGQPSTGQPSTGQPLAGGTPASQPPTSDAPASDRSAASAPASSPAGDSPPDRERPLATTADNPPLPNAGAAPADGAAPAAPATSKAPPAPGGTKPLLQVESTSRRAVTRVDGLELITFEDLNLGMQADMVFRDFLLTDRARELDGRKVRLIGYMDGGISQSKGIKEFILLRNTECKFGAGGQADHLVRVLLVEGVTINYTQDAVQVDGVLRINPFNGADGNTWSVFDLAGEQCKTIRRK